MKKLQIALDLLTLENALDVLSKVAEYVDIIEVGTPLIISEGCKAIETIIQPAPVPACRGAPTMRPAPARAVRRTRCARAFRRE